MAQICFDFIQPLPRIPLDTYAGISTSSVSNTTACNTGIDARDVFNRIRLCVVCGADAPLEHCHIIPQSEQRTWEIAREMGYIHPRAKQDVKHEPRNGLTMCSSHHGLFDNYDFFIRYVADEDKFVLVNVGRRRTLNSYHGKAIALSVRDNYAVYTALFKIHEARVRGHNPFEESTIIFNGHIPYQDWIINDGFVSELGQLQHQSASSGGIGNTGRPRTESDGPGSSGQGRGGVVGGASAHRHGPGNVTYGGSFFRNITTNSQPGRNTPMDATQRDNKVIIIGPDDDMTPILEAQRNSYSWKQVTLENNTWSGTAEENIKKYNEVIALDRVGFVQSV